MAFKYGAFLMICAQICTALAHPPCVCTRNLSPVCGSDGVTYNNQCLLECAASRGRAQITVEKEGPCGDVVPDTPECACIMMYLPVCGTDGQTYGNECALNCHKTRFNPTLAIKHSGECTTPGEPTCVCPDLRSPVCGSDGKTYDNQCSLNCHTVNDSTLSIAHNGPCNEGVQVARPKFD